MSFSWWYKKEFDPFFITNWRSYLAILVGVIPLYLLTYSIFDLYSPKRGQSFTSEAIKIVEANFISCLLLFGLIFILKLVFVSRILILLFVALNTFLTITAHYCGRRVLRYFRIKGFNQKHLLVIGAGELGQTFLSRIRAHREFGYNVAGFLDDDPSKQGKRIGHSQVIGKLKDLDDYLYHHYIDEVIIALPLAAYEKLSDIIETCEKHGIKALIIPDYYRYIPARPKVTEFVDLPLIHVRDIPLDVFFNRFIKRCFDIVGAFFLILFLSPLMLLIAIGIKMSSPGPVLFKQRRVGLNRKEFEMYKFRSMLVSTDEAAATGWTTAGDPRRTRFGAFIRAASLDELPQLFNVIKGEMSLIGPRPERPYFVEQFKEKIPKYMVKHQVKPGMTGWAQVNGWRGDSSIEERIKFDIYYIENWSLIFDLKILYLTAFKGFVNKNAY
ncbi:MAG: undecaprenyl-phosphate glucose phosphotransferase [Firmicutes bacterium]|nr:undecaprenyl-phosphate glucose phosphotransferase [Bacillota bacterium]